MKFFFLMKLQKKKVFKNKLHNISFIFQYNIDFKTWYPACDPLNDWGPVSMKIISLALKKKDKTIKCLLEGVENNGSSKCCFLI